MPIGTVDNRYSVCRYSRMLMLRLTTNKLISVRQRALQ